MKFLIAGLGNPGMQYRNNRHNIGFMAVDEIAAQQDLLFDQDRHGYTCTVKHRGNSIILLKPTTFMNLSGKAVRFHLQKNNLSPSNLLVITDDISLPFGKVRLREKGSAGGHNGLKDIQEKLGTQDYARCRVGVGDDFPQGRQADYVLSDFSSGEMIELDNVLERVAKAVLAFCGEGIQSAMNKYNG